MSRFNLNRSALIFLIALSGYSPAHAEQTPATSTPQSSQDGGPEACPWKRGDRAKYFEDKLKSLHEALKLNASQEKAWQAWSEQLHKNKIEWKSHHEDDANAPAKALDRLEQKLGRLKEKEKHLEEHIADTKRFYAVLTPSQKQVFDSEFARHDGKHRPPEQTE